MRFKHIFSLSLLSTLFILFACSEGTNLEVLTKTVSYTSEGVTEDVTLSLEKWDAVADGKHRGNKITFAELPVAAQDYLLKNADTTTVKAYMKLTAKDSTIFYLVKFADHAVAPMAFDKDGALITRPVGGGSRPHPPRDSSDVRPPHPPRDSSDVHPPRDSSDVRPPHPPRDSSGVRPPHPPRDSSGVRPPHPPRDSSSVRPPHPPRGAQGNNGRG